MNTLAQQLDTFIETLPAEEFYVHIPDDVLGILQKLRLVACDVTQYEARDVLHVWRIARKLRNSSAEMREIPGFVYGPSFDDMCELARTKSEENPGCSIHVNTRVELDGRGGICITHSVSDWFIDGCTQITYRYGSVA